MTIHFVAVGSAGSMFHTSASGGWLCQFGPQQGFRKLHCKNWRDMVPFHLGFNGHQILVEHSCVIKVVDNAKTNFWTASTFPRHVSLPVLCGRVSVFICNSTELIWRSSAIWTRALRTLTLTSRAKRESCHQSHNSKCMLGWPWFQFDGLFCRGAKGRDCKGTHRVSWAKRATLAKQTSWWTLCSLEVVLHHMSDGKIWRSN